MENEMQDKSEVVTGEQTQEQKNQLSGNKCSVLQKIRMGIVITAVAAAGYFASYLIRPASNAQCRIEEEQGIEYVVNGQQKLPLQNISGQLHLGNLDYRLDGIICEARQNNGKYLRNLMNFCLVQSAQDENSLEATLSSCSEYFQASPSLGNRFMAVCIDTLPPSKYSPECKDKIVQSFRVLGEKDPLLFNSMGTEFTSHARVKIVNDFLDQLKQDARNIWDAVTRTKTYRDTANLVDKEVKKTKEYSQEKIKEGYEQLKQNIIGGK